MDAFAAITGVVTFLNLFFGFAVGLGLSIKSRGSWITSGIIGSVGGFAGIGYFLLVYNKKSVSIGLTLVDIIPPALCTIVLSTFLTLTFSKKLINKNES